MKRYFFVVFAALLALMLSSGCQANNAQTLDSSPISTTKIIKSDNVNKKVEKKPLLIACIVNQDDQYMKLLQLGMSDEAEKNGVQVILANTYGNLDKEMELINTYIKSGVDGICIHPVSVDLSVPILQKAMDSGIKVISAGIRIDDKYKIGYIESDQTKLGEESGRACRDFIENKLGGKANIALLNYTSQFPEESARRTEGFKSEVTKLPEVKIVTEQEAWLSETAVTTTSGILSSNPDVNIIWAANEGGTVGAAMAVKNAGRSGNVFVFGTDVNEQLLNMLKDKDDILQAVTGQQPYEIGLRSLDRLMKDLKGEQTEGNIIIPVVPLSRNDQEQVGIYIEKFKQMIAPLK